MMSRLATWACLLGLMLPVAPAAPPDPPPEVSDLPLIEVPSHGTPSDTLAVLYSGDGGWTGLDKDVAAVLVDHGTGVVGVSSLRYFWKAKTPDGAAGDLERILRHYMAAWNRSRVVLIGYSRGADVLPFLLTRLPADLRSRVALMALLGPGLQATFELHVTELFVSPEEQLPILPEVKKAAGVRLLCVYGKDEPASLCHSLEPGSATLVGFDGAHHFGGSYAEIGEAILKQLSPP